jgi:hypothetical protein
MGNDISNLKEDQRLSHAAVDRAIKQVNGPVLPKNDPRNDDVNEIKKRDLNFTIWSTETSIQVYKENIEDLRKKLNIQEKYLRDAQDKQDDAKTQLNNLEAAAVLTKAAKRSLAQQPQPGGGRRKPKYLKNKSNSKFRKINQYSYSKKIKY